MRSWLILGTVAILALTGIYTCWCGTALIWDGSYQLTLSLLHDRAFCYETRFHSWVLWQPLVFLSHFTTNRTVLEMAYGLPFTLAPAAGLGISWWIVRRDAPELILWAIFGIAAAPLPGQIFIINDSIFQQHLFWPVFLAVFVPLTRGQQLVVCGLALFQLSHPIGMALLAGAGVAAGILGFLDASSRRRYLASAALLLALAGLAVLKLRWWPDLEAQKQCSWAEAENRWLSGVAGWPIRGIMLMWTAGALAFVGGIAGRRGHHRLALPSNIAAITCALGAGVMWTAWASDGTIWWKALDYRRWLVPLTIPFFALAFFDAVVRIFGQKRVALPTSPWHLALGCVLAGVFALVLTIQSRIWVGLTGRLEEVVRRCPGAVIDQQAVDWASGTPLDHWGMFTYIIWVQGRKPGKLLVRPDMMEQAMKDPAMVPYSDFDWRPPEPGPNGWFDHRPWVATMRAQRQ